MDLLILAGIVAGFYLLMAINRRIYKRGHLGNLGREADYVRKGYRGMYIHDKQPSPLHHVERVIPPPPSGDPPSR